MLDERERALILEAIELSLAEWAQCTSDIDRIERLEPTATPFEKKWGALLVRMYRRRAVLHDEFVNECRSFLAVETGTAS